MTNTSTFSKFAELVAETFQSLCQTPNVFVVGIDGDALYNQYLAAFPAGTNPLFRKRTEHDCSCCRHFIRRVGNVVTVEEGKLRTVWDKAAEQAPAPYNYVAECMRNAVLAVPIADLFRVSAKEASFGAAETRSLDAETGHVHTWDHLYTGLIPQELRVASPDQVRGDYSGKWNFCEALGERDQESLDECVATFKRCLEAILPTKPRTLIVAYPADEFLRYLKHAKLPYTSEHATRGLIRIPDYVIGSYDGIIGLNFHFE